MLENILKHLKQINIIIIIFFFIILHLNLQNCFPKFLNHKQLLNHGIHVTSCTEIRYAEIPLTFLFSLTAIYISMRGVGGPSWAVFEEMGVVGENH